MNFTTLRRSLLFVSLGSALLGPSLLAATDTPPPPPQHDGAGPHEKRFDPEKRLAHLTEKLHLTADQQAKLRPILAAEAEQIKAIDNTPLTGEQRREKIKELHKANRETIAAILTPEQRKQMREEHRKGHGGDGSHCGKPETPPAPGS